MFSFADTRYNRQVVMPEWGMEGQDKLHRARVVSIGAGGVKSTLLMALVAAGVGRLRIIEHDHVELSNLNRQLLYGTDDIGVAKVQAARRRLVSLNPECDIEAIERRVDAASVHELLDGYDIVVEGGDSPAGRNMINEYCLARGVPFVHASAQFSYGYVCSVVPARQTACFACYFPHDYERAEHTGPVPVNVLATSVAGTLGAAEVLKYLMGNVESMFLNRRLCFSSLLLSGEFVVEDTPRRPDCPVCSKWYV